MPWNNQQVKRNVYLSFADYQCKSGETYTREKILFVLFGKMEIKKRENPSHVWLITQLFLPICWIYGLSFLSNSPNLYRAACSWIGVLGLFTVIGYPTNILWLVSELLYNQQLRPFALLDLLHIILQILMLIAYYKIYIFQTCISSALGSYRDVAELAGILLIRRCFVKQRCL